MCHIRSRRLLRVGAIIAMTGITPSVALAQESSLMKGDGVLEKWAEKTGGKAREKIHNRVMNGSVEIPLMHLKGPLTTYAAAPGSKYEIWEPSAGQAYERGSDGANCWTVGPQGGALLLTGKAKSMALLEAAFNVELRWRELYAKAETIAIRSVKRLAVGDQPETQRPCYEVKMTPKDGECDSELWYIDTENFQRIGVIGKVKVGDGVMDRITLYADYRPVNDVLEPFVVCEQIDIQKQFITYKSIQHNVRMSKYRFDLPDAVKMKLAEAANGVTTTAPSTRPEDPIDKPPAIPISAPGPHALPATKENSQR